MPLVIPVLGEVVAPILCGNSEVHIYEPYLPVILLSITGHQFLKLWGTEPFAQ